MPGGSDQAGHPEPGLEKWLKVNTEYASKWPNIAGQEDPPEDAKSFDGVEGKFEKFFSPEPGKALIRREKYCLHRLPGQRPPLTDP